MYHNLKWHRDFPGGPVVRNLSCNAGDAGSIPGRGTKIPHATGQLSSHATTRETVYHNYRAHMLWSPHATTRETVYHNYRAHMLRSPHATTREKPTQCKEEPAHRNKKSRLPQLRPDAA